MADAVPPPTERSQSTTSLARMYHGANGAVPDETADPSLDFCNAFWGQDGRGYEVVMARLRGAARTVDELRAFWKERAAIEEDYAKRLSKLAKLPLGKDEVGDLQSSLQTIQAETAAQASYHLQLSTELHQTVEQPTAEFGNRLANLKKGLQASVEKSYNSKKMHEGHVTKARERYESDCIKLNSYTANMQLTQGKELEKLQGKIERVQKTIGGNETDFKNFVSVLESTTHKWENEWKSFCDYVQDMEEDRLSITKDIAWAYANAVSQVCVEDDSSCERIREKLEAFEPLSDMAYFARGWGTGSQIPDAPRFINYGAGEYPTQPRSHIANFQRVSSKAEPLQRTTVPRPSVAEEAPESREPPPGQGQTAQPPQNFKPESPQTPVLEIPPVPGKDQEPPSDGVQRLTLRDEPPAAEPPTGTFGGIPMPGMVAPAAQPTGIPEFHPPGSQVGHEVPPPGPAPPSPSARDVEDNDDPMARALAELRRDPPAPGRVRRGQSQRRTDSAQRNDSVRSGSGVGAAAAAAAAGVAGGAGAYVAAQQFQRSASPAPSMGQQQQQQQFQRSASPAPNVGQTFQRSASPAPSGTAGSQYGSQVGSQYGSQVGSQVGAPPGQQGAPPGHHARGSLDTGLVPPASGHTAAALARSMADFERKSQNPQHGRNSVNYSNYASDVIGEHPSSRPASRASARSARSPSPGAAMMQPPTQPATHIADQVLPQYHQAFPGERSRSRPASVYSAASRPGSILEPAQQAQQAPREGFVGIGTGSAAQNPTSPPGGSFRSPSPAPGGHGVLGPQNLGIALDERGGVAHDSMAEAYRREYQQRQMSQPGSQTHQSPPAQHQQPPQQPQHPVHRGSYGSFSSQQQQQQAPPPSQSPPAQWRSQVPANHQASMSQSSFSAPFSAQLGGQAAQYGQQPQQQQQQQAPQQQPQQQQYGQYGQPQQQQYAQQPPQQHQQQPPQQPQQQQQYNQFAQPQQQRGQQDPYAQHSYTSSAASYNPPAAYGQHPQQVQQHQQQQPPHQAQQQQQYAAQQQQYAQQQQPQQQQYDPYYQNQNGYNAAQQPASYRGASPQPGAQAQAFQQQQQKARTPSPQPNQAPANAEPTGQWASNGKPVIFYVKALYDYQAQAKQEFDFQVGDIIAVTECPEDGWWVGELLDESRRVEGKTDFPSNFVELLV